MENTLDRHYTDLDMQLQQLALVDWPTFVNLIGEENVISAKVLVLVIAPESDWAEVLLINTVPLLFKNTPLFV